MDDKSYEDNRIGNLLIREGLIDDVRLQFALSIQAAEEMYRPLGEILKSYGYVSGRKLQEVLRKYQKQILLGELLVKMGVISQEQLAEALEMQRGSSKRLGRILVEKGFTRKTRLADAICLQLGIAGANAAECRADSELLHKLNMAFLKAMRVMPLAYDKESNTVSLLMEDPTNKRVLDDLKRLLRANIEPVMLRDGWMEYVLDGVFDVWHYSDWRKTRRRGDE